VLAARRDSDELQSDLEQGLWYPCKFIISSLCSENYAAQFLWSSWRSCTENVPILQLIRYRKWTSLLTALLLCVVFALMVNVHVTTHHHEHHKDSDKHKDTDGKMISISKQDYTLSAQGMWICGFIVAFQVTECVVSFLALLNNASQLGISDVWVNFLATGAIPFTFLLLHTEGATRSIDDCVVCALELVPF